MARRQNEEAVHSREIAGIIVSALGVFLGFGIFSADTGWLGKNVGAFVFGLFGIAGYLIPFIVLVAGVLVILSMSRRAHIGKISLVAGCFFFFVGFLHMLVNQSIHVSDFLGYIQESFLLGAKAHSGGGFFGALLAFPAQWALGEVGAYMLFITGILIYVLVLTNLSLKKTGQSIADRIRNMRQPKASESEIDLYAGVGERKPKRELAEKAAEGPFIEPIVSPHDPTLLRESKNGIDIFPSKGPLPKSADYPFSLFGDDDGDDMKHAGSADVDLDECIPPAYEYPGPRGYPEPDVRGYPEPETLGSPEFGNVRQAPPYVKPPLTLLNPPPKKRARSEDAAETARLLLSTLSSFGVNARVTDICVGPVITRYELQPAAGVRVNRITNLADDLALSLAAPRVRIEAPIPGKAAIGIEIPNKDVAVVSLRELIEYPEFESNASPISVVLGKDIAGKPIYADLGRMPHLLIAGSTGSGKSVCINDLIVSIAYKTTPDDVKLILIDPKVVELSVFGSMPHLLVPVVTDPKKAAGALNWAVQEMVKRYQAFAKLGARDLTRYNELILAKGETKLPYIVTVIDELADLMMVAPNEVEDSICRLAQMGRACGMHLVVATQRPSADIITGLIKANIPSRIAFAVASGTDSRIILDTMGAEKLLGRGDMLFYPTGASKPTRVQGAYVSDVEVERLSEFFQKRMGGAVFDRGISEEMNSIVPQTAAETAQSGGDFGDELMSEAVALVMENGQASISMIQRRFRVGYARAARIIDIMEQMGVISAAEGSKPRRILITRLEADRMFNRGVGPNL